MKNETDENVKLENTAEIELPTMDITPYVGVKTKIEDVTEHQGKYGYFIKVSSQTLDVIRKQDKDIDLKATRIFGLQEDSNGNIGWGRDTKLGKFLKKMNVKHYKELIGKEIQIIALFNEDKEKDFLSFN